MVLPLSNSVNSSCGFMRLNVKRVFRVLHRLLLRFLKFQLRFSIGVYKKLPYVFHSFEMDESSLQYADNPKILRIRTESGTEDVHYPLMYEGLPEEAKLYAERELNETEESKSNGIRKLKEYVKREGLTCPDDSVMVAVLRNCKYDISKSKSKLKRFLRSRQLIINKIAEMDMETIKVILDDFSLGLFPWRDKHGGVILYTRPTVCTSAGKCKTDDFVFCCLVQALFMLQFPLSSIYGFSSIGESKGPYFNHYFTLNAARKMIFFLFDMPYRILRSDLINEHALVRWCIKMLRPFISEKLKKRIMFHGSDLGSLHKFYHPDILPEEVGGHLGPASNKHYREELLMFIERLREENIQKMSTDL